MEPRTLQQNKALHLRCKQIADALNEAGLPMQKVLKPSIEIDWTPENVKEYLWKPIMKALYVKESTTELSKSGEIDHIDRTLIRMLGEKFHIELPPFPSEDPDKDRLDSMHIDVRNDPNYPDQEDLEVKF